MPEGPEAKVIANELEELIGMTITKVEINSEDKFENMEQVVDKTIKKVFSIGKKVFIQLDEGYIVTSLAMTGKWCFYQPQYQSLLTLTMNTNRIIYFIDSRKFGNVCYVDNDIVRLRR